LLELRIIFVGENMLASATIADVLRPCEKRRATFYDIILIIGGSLVIALSAQVKILLPFSRVPITGQTFAVLMIAALFGARRGSFAVLAYIIEGLVGLPVFALGSGFAVLRGFTGGVYRRPAGREGMGQAS